MKSDGRMRGFTLIVRWVMAKLQSLWSESETWGGLNRERERKNEKEGGRGEEEEEEGGGGGGGEKRMAERE